jgi:hypothetical protein
MTMLRSFWDAACTLDPRAYHADDARLSALCRLEPLFNLFDRAGVADLALRAIDVQATFEGFTDFWGPFLTGQGAGPHYAMSLAPERREALGIRLVQTLPIADDGSLILPLRAWAIKGHK